MKENEDIKILIENFIKKLVNQSEIDDFFDLGVSSLSVVELQVKIEEVLGFNISTAKLMANPTLNGWVALYQKNIN